MHFCEKCGARIDNEMVFCPECGSPVNQQVPAFKEKGNSALIAIISILATILILLVIFFVLYISGAINFNKNDEVKLPETVTQKVVQNNVPEKEIKKANSPAHEEVKETIWTYDEDDAEDFIENSLYAFVNGINMRSTDYVYTYFSGSEANQEIATHNEIVKVVDSEEILSVDCHSVQRISNSRITVIRDSVIRVYYTDGRVKDIPEKYRYTIDLSSGTMKIVALESV